MGEGSIGLFLTACPCVVYLDTRVAYEGFRLALVGGV